MVDFNPDDLPKQLNTAEDYVQSCENFVLPFFFEQSKKIANTIEKLHIALAKGALNQEQIEIYVNEILEISAFSSEDNLMYPYFQKIMELEQKLESEGAFAKTETETKKDD